MSEELDAHPERRITYLVGPRESFLRYCREHDVSPRSRYVKHVSGAQHIRGVRGGVVLFLRGWTDLPEWRDLYAYVAARRALGVLE